MSTFSRVYKQYNFLDPFPPFTKVYRLTFCDLKQGLPQHNITVQQQKLTHLPNLLCDK